MDLLKKAKEFAKKGRATAVSKEEVSLCLAYLRGEVTVRQYAHAIEMKEPGNVTHRIAVVLRKALQEGWIQIKQL